MQEIIRSALLCCVIALVVAMLACLYRAIRGPRFTDRLVAANMIGTMTMATICILAYYLRESYLLDIALVYALLSFLAVIVICRFATFHYHGKILHKEDKKNG